MAIRKVWIGLACVLLTLLAASVSVSAEDLQAIPALTARVTDLTATLAASDIATLDAELAALERRKGAQIAVLMIATSAPKTIEQYATRVFDAWKLGRKNVDDGVLVVVAKNDRHVRIEVAYGLEGAIPDAAAKRIAHDYMSPRFRDGDFAGGLEAGSHALIALIDDEPLPAPPAQRASDITDMAWWNPLYFAIGLLFGGVTSVLTVLLFTRPRIYRALLGRVPERARPFAIGAVNAIPVGILLRNPLSIAAALLTGAGLAAVAGLSRPPNPVSRRRGRGGGTGSSGSSSSDSSSSGGSSSDSGFSGGGGGSGGGGASDSW